MPTVALYDVIESLKVKGVKEMETKDIIKRAKVLNWIEIIITLALYVSFRIMGTMAKSATTQLQINNIIEVQQIILIVVGVISAVVIIMTIILMVKNQKRVKGLGLLLASGIITLIFAILGVTLGLIIWILSGASLSALKQKNAEDDFEARLQKQNQTPNMNQNMYTNQTPDMNQNMYTNQTPDMNQNMYTNQNTSSDNTFQQ